MRRGITTLVIASFLWGIGNAITGYTAAQYLHTRTLLPAVDIALVNTLGGLLFLVGVHFFSRVRNINTQPAQSPWHPVSAATILSGVMKGINTCAFVFSTTHVPATQALICESTYIVWSVMLAVISKRAGLSMRSTVLKAGLLSLGIVLVLSPDLRFSVTTMSTAGVFFGFSAGLTYAMFLYFWSSVTSTSTSTVERTAMTLRMLTVSAITIILITALSSWLFVDSVWKPVTHLRARDALIQLVNGASTVGLVYLLVTIGMSAVRNAAEGSSVVAAFCLSLAIPWTLLPEALIGKFTPSPPQLFGIGLFMFAFVLVNKDIARLSNT